jgi:hypothetical protein
LSAPLLSLRNVKLSSTSKFDLSIVGAATDLRAQFFLSLFGSNSAETWEVDICEVEGVDALQPFDRRFFHWLQDFDGTCPQVFLDISCLSPPIMAEIFATFFSAARSLRFSVTVGYVIAAFTPPPDNLPPNDDIRPVSEEFAGWPRYPSARTSLVVGLGYEREKAEGACEYFDSNEIQVFIPTSPIIEYGNAIAENNKILLADAARNKKAHSYRLDDPEQTFGQLISIICNLVTRSNPVILPLGPKLFFALSLIVAELYKEVGVWHVTGDLKANKDQYEPSEHFIGFKMELGSVTSLSESDSIDIDTKK